MVQKNDFFKTFNHNFISLGSICLILVPNCSSLQELSFGMLTLGIANIIPKLEVQNSTQPPTAFYPPPPCILQCMVFQIWT